MCERGAAYELLGQYCGLVLQWLKTSGNVNGGLFSIAFEQLKNALSGDVELVKSPRLIFLGACKEN